MKQDFANDDAIHNLLEFIDITNIKVNETDGTSSYKFNCKETSKSKKTIIKRTNCSLENKNE